MAVKELNEGNKTRWEAFCAALGKTADEIATKLEPLVGDINDDAIDMLGNDQDTPTASLVKALEGVAPEAKLNRAIRGIRNAPAPVAAAPAPAPAPVVPPTVRAAEIMLVSAPGDDDLLKALKLGGRPEFEPVNVAAVVRAAVARRNGVYDLPERLVDAIRGESRKQRKPNPPILIQVRRELAKRSNVAAIFADLFPEESKGGGTAYVSDKDKTETLKALDGIWPALIAFQNRLRAFRMEAMTAAMTAGMATQMGGGMGFAAMGLDPSMLMGVNLDTSSYVDDVEGIIDALNGVFMDQGLYASRVLAEEGSRLTGILKMDGLVAAVGCTNYEDMLRELKIGVTADVIRGQTDLATWLINVVTLQEKDSASLPGVLLALCMLGDRIPWEKLSAGSVHLEREAPPQFPGAQPPRPPAPAPRPGGRGERDEPRRY